MIAEIFAVLGLLAYSGAFRAAYAVPKLAVLSIGAVVLAASVVFGGKTKDPKPVALMMAVIAVCAIFADDQWLAIAGRYNSYAMGMMGIGIAMLYYLASSGETRILPLVGAAMGIHAFAQYAGVLPGAEWFQGSRAIGTIGSPVDLGLILAMLLPLAWSKSLVYAVAVGLGIIATGSRGALIAGAAGIAAMRLR